MSPLATGALYGAQSFGLVYFSGRQWISQYDQFLKGLVLLISIFTPSFILGRSSDYHFFFMYLMFFALEQLFPRVQYSFAGTNQLIDSGYFAFKKMGYVFLWLFYLQMEKLPSVPWAMKNHGVPFWIQGIAILLAVDFKQFLWHWCEHRYERCWRFHKTHHSTSELSILAAHRVNFIELFFIQQLSSLILIYVLGVTYDAFFYFYSYPAILIAVLFAHANLNINSHKVPILRYIINTPDSHGWHHDTRGNGANYSEIFVWWDMLFGTYYLPENRPNKFGIRDQAFLKLGHLRKQIYPIFKGKFSAGINLK